MWPARLHDETPHGRATEQSQTVCTRTEPATNWTVEPETYE